jgi:hypothetical protein
LGVVSLELQLLFAQLQLLLLASVVLQSRLRVSSNSALLISTLFHYPYVPVHKWFQKPRERYPYRTGTEHTCFLTIDQSENSNPKRPAKFWVKFSHDQKKLKVPIE